MKKIISIILSVAMIFSVSLQVFAISSVDETTSLVYREMKNNYEITIHYYLDNNGLPYCIENSKILYIILPLPQFKVTDDEQIKELNRLFNKETIDLAAIKSGAPTNYIDISSTIDNDSLISKAYQKHVDFDTYTTVTTSYLKVNPSLSRLHVKTLNMQKKLLSGSKITLTLYFYNSADGNWYNYTYVDNYNNYGKYYIFSPSFMPFIRAKVAKSSSGVKNFDLNLHTWATA